MNLKRAILITPGNRLVDEVRAYVWSGYEIRRVLAPEHEFVYRQFEKTDDTIALDGFLNFTAAGRTLRSDGFELFGEEIFGPALIVPGNQKRWRPDITPQEIRRSVRFFRLEPMHHAHDSVSFLDNAACVVREDHISPHFPNRIAKCA